MSNRNSPKKRARLSGENLFVYIRSYIAKFPSGVQSSQVNDDYAKNYQGSFAYCLRMALNLNTNKCKLDKLLSYVPGVITTASSNGTVIYTLASQQAVGESKQSVEDDSQTRFFSLGKPQLSLAPTQKQSGLPATSTHLPIKMTIPAPVSPAAAPHSAPGGYFSSLCTKCYLEPDGTWITVHDFGYKDMEASQSGDNYCVLLDCFGLPEGGLLAPLWVLVDDTNTILVVNLAFIDADTPPIDLLHNLLSMFVYVFVNDVRRFAFLFESAADSDIHTYSLMDMQIMYELLTGTMPSCPLTDYLSLLPEDDESAAVLRLVSRSSADNMYSQLRQSGKFNKSPGITYATAKQMIHFSYLLASCEQVLWNSLLDIRGDYVDLLTSALDATLRKLQLACEHGAHRKFIGFDDQYVIRSRELVDSGLLECESSRFDRDAALAFSKQCNIKQLLDLLPAPIYMDHALRSKLEQDCCDIVLDMGRPAYWTPRSNPGKRQYFTGTRTITRNEADHGAPGAVESTGQQVLITHEDLQSVCDKVRFGGDNRAGLNRELHRISCMCDRAGQVYGLTLRIGRSFPGNCYMLSDLLLHADYQDKSILILGLPGSGKTSMIREVARILSDTHNVCIIDTSNEIGGDGNVPHDCVGHARRMMVNGISDQHAVMVECVQNHTPQVMVVDEIGREQEIKAAHTIKQRGVRLIASAHGDFRSLIKNKELNKLLGGVVSTTVGDAAAKQNDGNKLKSERGGAPIFDIVVEVSRGQFDECRVILNTAQAVDNELERKSITAQVRGRVLVDLPSGGSDTLDFDVEAAVSTGSDDVFQSVSSVSVAEMQLIYMHTIEL